VDPVIAAEPPPAEVPPAGPTPAPQPPPVLPPLAPPPASTRSGSSAGLWIIASILGVLLILGGVFGLFAFALLRPRPAPTVVAVSASDAGSGAPLVEEPDGGASLEPDAGAQTEDDAGLPEASDGGAPIELGDGGLARTNPKSRANVALEAIVPLPITPEVAVWGGRKPLITIVWFGDLECPHTRHAYTTMVALERAFGDELRIAFRHRPLSIHTRARPAARVAAGLRREKGDLVFRSFLSSVSASSDAPTTERLEAWVEGVGGDRSRVNEWMNQRETESELARDLAIAALYDVRETPTFFVNGIRIEGDLPFDDFKPIVEKELSAARALMALGTPLADIYAARVRKNMLGLGTDVVSRTCPAIAGSPARGPNDALVTIVEFSDFECPFCKRVQTSLQTVLARHGGDVRLVWKNFPLDFHPHARPAATFALEAEKRGGPAKFWKVHDRLFASQSNLDEAGLASIAAEVGLDGDALLDAVRRRSHDAKIEADVKLAKQLGVRGTPTFFINGRVLAGAQPAERFEAVVQEEIDGARRLVGSGTPRSRVYDAVCGAH
jgi:protein-disulfide isomerase